MFPIYFLFPLSPNYTCPVSYLVPVPLFSQLYLSCFPIISCSPLLQTNTCPASHWFPVPLFSHLYLSCFPFISCSPRLPLIPVLFYINFLFPFSSKLYLSCFSFISCSLFLQNYTCPVSHLVPVPLSSRLHGLDDLRRGYKQVQHPKKANKKYFFNWKLNS